VASRDILLLQIVVYFW